jgi:nitrate/nitrite transporter NarK
MVVMVMAFMVVMIVMVMALMVVMVVVVMALMIAVVVAFVGMGHIPARRGREVDLRPPGCRGQSQ